MKEVDNNSFITITDSQFMDFFAKSNFQIRTAIIERLAKGWQGAKIGIQFGILIGVLEQYISLIEDIVMFLYALRDKNNNKQKSLFFCYSKIHIKENIEGQYSTGNLINILNNCDTNNDYAKVFGFNLAKLNLKTDGYEFRDLFQELIKEFKKRTFDLPLVKVNNVIKHGFRVILDETSNVPNAVFIIDTTHSDQNISNVEIRTLPVKKDVIDNLFDRAKILSKYFRGIFICIQKSFS